jgi:glutathione peroxidase
MMRWVPLLMALPTIALAAPTKEKTMTVHDLSAATIDGENVSFGSYKGKVLLIVNVASECGFTPQYAGLEKLWQQYKGRGVVVLGFPSNDFGAQEPGSEAEIKKFCSTKFHVTFPMFSKVKTKGDGASSVYRFLAPLGEPKWNFHKYLIGKNGVAKAAFPSKVAPNDPTLHAAIEAALKD